MSDVQVYIRQTDRQTFADTSNWESLTLVQRRNDVGRWTLVTKDVEDARVLARPTDSSGTVTGRRGIIVKRPLADGTLVTLASGWVLNDPGVTTDKNGDRVWTFSGWDDTFVLRRALCWPKPDALITAQTDAYFVTSGPASDRIQRLAILNAGSSSRMPGEALLTGNTLGLGPTGRTQVRFEPSLLVQAQEIAGRSLNFAVQQRDSDRALFLQQWLPPNKTLDVQFSPALGTVQSWDRGSTDTVANVVVIGAGGEGEARKFRRYQSNTDVAANGPIEAFKDRRDLAADDPDLESKLLEDAAQFLEENIGRPTFKFELVASPDQRYGVEFRVGDRVRAYVDQDINGVPVDHVDDLIEQVTVTWSAEGERCEIEIGAADQKPTLAMARRLRRMDRRIRELEARR